MKEKKEKPKHSSLSNVLYMLKILWRGSKGYVIYTFIKEFNETASVGVAICSNLRQTAVLCDSSVVCFGVLWQLSATIKTK